MPVRRATVRIHTERNAREVVIFLAPETPPEDLFEQEAPFFPAEEDATIRLFARASIVSVVVVAKAGEGGDGREESLSVLGIPYETRSVTVHLRSGEELRGTVASIGRTRTLDLLNQAAKSFPLRVGDEIHHISKAHVEFIAELR